MKDAKTLLKEAIENSRNLPAKSDGREATWTEYTTGESEFLKSIDGCLHVIATLLDELSEHHPHSSKHKGR